MYRIYLYICFLYRNTQLDEMRGKGYTGNGEKINFMLNKGEYINDLFG